MRKRFVVAAVCILALPLVYSSSQKAQLTNPSPYATLALAGRTSVGAWCDCGSPGCICDPGEEPSGQSATPAPDQHDASLKHAAPSGTGGLTDFDFGSGALMLALACLLWTRLRA